MNRDAIQRLCKAQRATLKVSGAPGHLEATVSLPEGLMWSFGHTAIGLTQRIGQAEADFWDELFLGMNYAVVPEV